MRGLQQRSVYVRTAARRVAGSVILALTLGHAATANDFSGASQSAPAFPNYLSDAGQVETPSPPDSVAAAAAPAAAPAGTAAPQPGIGGILLAPDWDWQGLPSGLIYHSYLAGVKEPRMASQWVIEKNHEEYWETELGGRVGVVRYGTDDAQHPQGWELDMEGAAFPRLNLQESESLTSVDFRFGLPLTYGYGNYQMKFGYYHICSHLGDQFMLQNPTFERVHYVRNALVWGHSYNWTDDIRLYAEAGWAFECSGGAKPWELQFGAEYSPAQPTYTWRPRPFVAINTDLRQEVNFSGNFVLETGYQWRGEANHLFRAGLQYFTGKSDQYQFFNQYEEKIGLGLWYDF